MAATRSPIAKVWVYGGPLGVRMPPYCQSDQSAPGRYHLIVAMSGSATPNARRGEVWLDNPNT